MQTAEPILGRDRGALLKERPLARLDPPRPSRSRCIIGKASVLSFAEFRPSTRGDDAAALAFHVNKIPISAAIEVRDAQEMVALVLRRRIGSTPS